MSSDTGSNQTGDRRDEDVLEPIAVIGISLRFPQDAVSEDTFWEMLLNQKCAATRYPEDRINIDGFYNSDPTKDNTVRKTSILSRYTRDADCSR
jgi:acyl transferase domain-containing protein